MSDIEKVKECTKDAEEIYFAGEIVKAYDIFLKCEELALELGDQEWIAETKKNVGRVLHRLGKYREAERKYLDALKIIDNLNLTVKKPRYLNHLANVYQYLLNFDEYYKCLIEGLEISKKLENNYLIAKFKNSIGVYYEVMGDYERALEYLKEALKLYNEYGANENIFAGNYNIISSVLTKLGEFEKAIVYSDKAYALSLKNKDLGNKAYSLRNKIRAFYLMGKIEECIEYFDDLLKIKDQIENIKMKSEILRLIGQIYHKLKDLKNSIECYREALKIAKDLNFYYGMAETYKAIADLYYNIENYSEAFRNYSNSLKSYETILNSITNPNLRLYYEQKLFGLTEIIKKINDILENQSFEINFLELEQIPNNAIKVCKEVQSSNVNEIVAQVLLESTRKLNNTSTSIIKDRDNYKKLWISSLNERCFLKLETETQDYLIRYKETLDKMPDDYRSCIRRIGEAIESELKIKIFEGFREKWLNQFKEKIIINGLWSIDNYFRKTLIELKNFLIYDKFLNLDPIYYILSAVYNIDSLKHIPEMYLKPFISFRAYIGEKNISNLKNIIDFLEYKFKCGVKEYNFIFIRNSCSHGGGKKQEKRKGIEINLSQEMIKSIENKLVNEDLNLLSNLCSLEI